jgi:hypothetical protein
VELRATVEHGGPSDDERRTLAAFAHKVVRST